MGLFERFPYTNFHDLNLTWILNELKTLEHTINEFVSINALKYADPIQWNIVTQYEKNTIVIDPLTGTAYISVQPVPSGVALTNTDYWTVVFDLGAFVVRAAKNFTSKFEEQTTLTATFTSSVNDWLIWGDVLYRVIAPINIGDQYSIGSNIIHFTAEEIIGHIQDLNTTDKSNLVAAVNEVLTYVGDINNLTTTDKSNLVAAVNEVLTLLINTTGDLDNLNTTDKSNLVSAINEVNTFARANKRLIKISELDDTLVATIQSAINQYDIIDFDVDVDLGSSLLTIGSNKEIFSSNGSKISGTACVLHVIGNLASAYTATLSFTSKNKGTYVGTLDPDKEYLIVSDQNAIGTEAYTAFGYPNYMGGGTSGLTHAYPAVFTRVSVDNSNNFVTDVCTYGYFTDGKAYEFTPAENVYIHDIYIDSTANTNAIQNPEVPVHLECAANCLVENVSCTVGLGNCFTTSCCHDVTIRGCKAAAIDDAPAEIFYNNVFRIAGCYHVIIENCSGHGSQTYDITYSGPYPYTSAYCVIRNSISEANYSGFTTHPGTWSCTIDGLKAYLFGTNINNGCGVRGSLHTIKNCLFYGNFNAGSYGMGSVEGCLCHSFENNIVIGFAHGFYVHDSANKPFHNLGLPFLKVNNNYFISCANLLRLHKDSATGNIGIGLTMNGNSWRNDSALTNNQLILYLGSGGGLLQFIDISDLHVYYKTISHMIYTECTAALQRVCIELVSNYSPSLDISYSGTGTVTNAYASVKTGTAGAITTVGTQLTKFTENVT